MPTSEERSSPFTGRILLRLQEWWRRRSELESIDRCELERLASDLAALNGSDVGCCVAADPIRHRPKAAPGGVGRCAMGHGGVKRTRAFKRQALQLHNGRSQKSLWRGVP